MRPAKSKSRSAGQLSFARELFTHSAHVPGHEEFVSATPTPTLPALPSTPNRFGYQLYALQDSTLFKRAVLWCCMNWFLRAALVITAEYKVIPVIKKCVGGLIEKLLL